MTIRREDSDRTDLSDVTTGERLPSVTPGDVPREDFMAPSACTPARWRAAWACRRTA